MRAIVFTAAEESYAIALGQIVEVIPRVAPRPIGNERGWVLGLIDYRGSLVPLLDVCMLVGRDPCSPRMSNRVLVVHLDETENARRMMGLLVDRVIGVQSVDLSDTNTHPGFELSDVEHLGTVARTDAGLVQFLEPSKILTSEQCAVLFDRDRIRSS